MSFSDELVRGEIGNLETQARTGNSSERARALEALEGMVGGLGHQPGALAAIHRIALASKPDDNPEVNDR